MNKYTLNEAIKSRVDTEKKIDVFVLVCLIFFIIFNIILYTKSEEIKNQTIEKSFLNETSIEKEYIDLLLEKNEISANSINKNIILYKDFSFDEIIFYKDYVHLVYFDEYEKDIIKLREKFSFVHIYSVDNSGVKIEVKYE